MHQTASVLAAGAIALFVSGCGHRNVAPPEAPARVVPSGVEMRSSPPEPGYTRVIIDANGERATVTEVVDVTTATAHAEGIVAHGRSETTKPICLTPCTADLKPGMHVLRFTSVDSERMSEANLQLGDKPKVLRHAMGRTEDASALGVGAYTLVFLGAITAVTGASLYGAARAGVMSEYESEFAGLVAGGAGAMVIGIPLMFLAQPVRQPGASTELSLP